MTGAGLVLEILAERGVQVVFGYPGASVMPLYEELAENSRGIRHVLSSHEQGAAHAADGYARASGRVGVVISTSGPGATNLVTGIAAAYMDSTPLVAITGNVPLSLLGRDSFQETDIAGVVMPITKYSIIVKDVRTLAEQLRYAFDIACSGRPGPVLIDIPRNVLEDECELGDSKPFEYKVKMPEEDVLRETADWLASFSRPLIVSGGGVRAAGAEKAVEELAARLDAPVCSTLMGLGTVSWDNPLYLGMIGIHGTPQANRAAQECDLIIGLGTRFTERVAFDRAGFAPGAQIFHIDIDEAEIDKNIPTNRHITGNLADILPGIINYLPECSHHGWRLKVGHSPAGHGKSCAAEQVIHELWNRRMPEDIIVTDVGQHQMWVAQNYGFSTQRLLTSGGLGAMGFGMGAACGAALAKPQSRVILVTGDGSFHMNMGELAVAVTENLPVKIIVMNNGALGMVGQVEKYSGRHPFGVATGRKTDFAALARAMGAGGITVRADGEVGSALDKLLEYDGPCLLDCIVDASEDALPMIPAGGGVEHTIL